jgi:hypothetical protein
MASKLFQTLVVSSSLLLSSGCAAVVRADEPDAEPDASLADASSSDRAQSAPDASAQPDASAMDAAVRDSGALVDASHRDARRREAGWPTTKGSFCEFPEVGPAFCCSTTGNGWEHGTGCCIPDPDDDQRCVACVIDVEARTCDPNAVDAAVSP